MPGEPNFSERVWGDFGDPYHLDQQPLEVVLRLMEESDLAVVSLQSGVYRAAYPSKTMMYLKAGCRLFAVVEPESELDRFVTRERLGAVCGPGDATAIAAALRLELERGTAGPADRARARAACDRFFGRPAVLGRWSQLVRQVGGEHCGG